MGRPRVDPVARWKVLQERAKPSRGSEYHQKLKADLGVVPDRDHPRYREFLLATAPLPIGRPVSDAVYYGTKPKAGTPEYNNWWRNNTESGQLSYKRQKEQQVDYYHSGEYGSGARNRAAERERAKRRAEEGGESKMGSVFRLAASDSWDHLDDGAFDNFSSESIPKFEDQVRLYEDDWHVDPPDDFEGSAQKGKITYSKRDINKTPHTLIFHRRSEWMPDGAWTHVYGIPRGEEYPGTYFMGDATEHHSLESALERAQQVGRPGHKPGRTAAWNSDEEPREAPNWYDVDRGERQKAWRDWGTGKPPNFRVEDSRLWNSPEGVINFSAFPDDFGTKRTLDHEWPEESARYISDEDDKTGVMQPMVGMDRASLTDDQEEYASKDSWEMKYPTEGEYPFRSQSATKRTPAKKKPKERKPEEVWYDVHKHPAGVPGGMGKSPEHHLRNRGWSGHEINEGSGKKTIQYRNAKHPDFVISYGGAASTKPDHNFRVLYMGGNKNIPKVTRAYSVAEAMNKVEELQQLEGGLVVQPMTHGAAAQTTPSLKVPPIEEDSTTYGAPWLPEDRRDMTKDLGHPIGYEEPKYPTTPDSQSDWTQVQEIKPPKPVKDKPAGTKVYGLALRDSWEA